MTKRGSDELYTEDLCAGPTNSAIINSNNNNNNTIATNTIAGNPEHGNNGQVSPPMTLDPRAAGGIVPNVQVACTLTENEFGEASKKVKLDGHLSPAHPQQQQQQQQQHQQAPPPQMQQANGNSISAIGGHLPTSPPSRVVHMRNIPSDATENDLLNVGLPFGRVAQVLLLRGKNQALVEFGDLSAAQTMVAFWADSAALPASRPSVRGRHIFVQFSNHKELKTAPIGAAGGGGGGAGGGGGGGMPHGMGLMGGLDLVGAHLNNNNNNNHHTAQALHGLQSSNGNGLGLGTPPPMALSPAPMGSESSVLRVIVDSLVFPVSLDTLYGIFSRYGKITKIVTFSKSGTFQALIQFEGREQATGAKLGLDGQQMFAAGNVLKVEFSKLQTLNVKYNNEKSRDFTNPLLPPGNTPQVQGSQAAAAAAAAASAPMSAAHAAFAGHNFNDALAALDPLSAYTAAAFQGAGGAPFGMTGPSYAASLRAALGHAHGGLASGHGMTGHTSPIGMTGHASMGHSPGFGSVLLVSNLNEHMVTPDALFTLFGVYGDVIRVKILFNKKDNALIQMAEAAQAQLALTYLDKVRLFGKPLKVSPSKHSLVQMPKEGQPDAGLTKDFSNSPLHRFKKPGSKNYLNIYPPSATLHLSNIPPSVTEEDIRAAFGLHAALTVVNFKFFPKDRKMALIQLPGVEEAVTALVRLHNHQLSESNHLRVSFSKSSI